MNAKPANIVCLREIAQRIQFRYPLSLPDRKPSPLFRFLDFVFSGIRDKDSLN
jgi:hypothetical protein